MLAPLVDVLTLLLGIGSTVWVGRSLRAPLGAALAPPRLGFHLLALGCVGLAVALGPPPDDLQQAVQHLCRKTGTVLLLLGALRRFALAFTVRP